VTLETDPQGFAQLTAKIAADHGIGCNVYKEKCLRRRIAVRMRARGVHSFDEYSRLLDQEPAEYQKLLDALTINVTKFWRNPETWRFLVDRVLPGVWSEREGAVRVWSAGCASGEEPYSVAIALAEVASRAGRPHALSKARVDATDIDRVSLERCRAAEYPKSAFDELPGELFQRYLESGPAYRVKEEVRRVVEVISHDLTRLPAPRPPYDVVICRNVIIYFDRKGQEALFHRFHKALDTAGYLVLGKVETLVGEARQLFELVDARERIYRKRA
jgi:chemotaxis protein methyltransferase CheR